MSAESLAQNVPRALARRALLFHRADDGDAPAGWHLGLSSGSGKGTERAFGIHRAAPVEQITLAAHRRFAGEGVNVAQQQNLLGTVTFDANRAAGFVNVGDQAVRLHPLDQIGRGGGFLLGGGGDGDEVG